MSELPSALFSIADGSEFRFARFYNVCEAAALVATRKFAHCLGFVGHTPGVFKRGRDTESDANIRLEEILTFFSTEFPSAFPSEIPRCGLLSDNITYQPKEIYAYCDNSTKKALPINGNRPYKTVQRRPDPCERRWSDRHG